MKKTAKILVLILSLCLIIGAVALTTVFADTETKEVTFDYYFGDNKFSAGKVAEGDTFTLPTNLDYAVVDRTNGGYINGAQAVAWTWNMNASGEYDAENFYPVDASAFNFDTVYANFIQKGYKLIIKADSTGITPAYAKGFMIVEYSNGLERVCPISATGTYDYLQDLDTAEEIAPAFRALVVPGSSATSYAHEKTLVLTCDNFLPGKDVADSNMAGKRGGFDLYADAKQKNSVEHMGGPTGVGTKITIDLNGRVLSIGWGGSGLTATFYAQRGGVITVYSSIPGGEFQEQRYNGSRWDSQRLFWFDADFTLNLGKYTNPNTGIVSDGDNLSMAVSALFYISSGQNVNGNVNIDGGNYRFSAATSPIDLARTVNNCGGHNVSIKNASISSASPLLNIKDVTGLASTVVIDNCKIESPSGLFTTGTTDTVSATVTNSKIYGAPGMASVITVGKDCLLMGDWSGVTNFTGGATATSFTDISFTITGKLNASTSVTPLSVVDNGTTYYYLPDIVFANVTKTVTGSGITTIDYVEESFDYYYGDNKWASGMINSLSGIQQLPESLDYAIVNRTEGAYVLPGQTVSWEWNMNDAGEYDANDYHPVDLNKFNFATFKTNFIDANKTLIIKANLEESAVATAKGFMIVEYKDGFEKVCPISATGTYDYLQDLDTAEEIAPVFRNLIAPSANNTYASNKTLVLTCGELLPASAGDRQGFDLFADERAQTYMMNLGGSNNITIDLNGRTLTLGLTTGTAHANGTFYAQSAGNSFTVYSSVPGGEFYDHRYKTTKNGYGNHIVGTELFWANAPLTVNFGEYTNPNTGVISDGDNLSMALPGLLRTTNAAAAGTAVNIDGGSYQFYGTPSAAVVSLTHGSNHKIIIKNATINNATRAPFLNITATGSQVNIEGCKISNIATGQKTNGAYTYLDFATEGTVAPITITESKIVGNLLTGSIVTLGLDNVLLGSGWDSANIVGDVTKTSLNASFTSTGKFNCYPNQELYYMDGTCYYIADVMFADSSLIFAGTAVYTGTAYCEVVYKDTNGDTLETVEYAPGSMIAHPAQTVVGQSNGWYALAVTANGWTVPNGTVVTEDTVVNPEDMFPIKALKLMWNASTANYPQINIYVPHIKDASGNEILPEGLTPDSYTVTGNISKNGFKQVDSNETQWMSYISDNRSIAQASSWINFTVSYSVTYGNDTYNFSETVNVSPANYAESVVYDEQTNDEEKMWAYAWLNYLYRSFDACNAGAADVTVYTDALTAFEKESFYKNYAEGKLADYEDEIAADAEAADADDYAALENFDGVLGFAWAYHYGSPNIVIYLDKNKTVAANDTIAVGKITIVKVAGLNSDLSKSTPANKVYNQWGETTVTVDSITYDAIWCNNVMKGMNDILSDIEIIVTYYTDTDGKTATVSGTYSLADYIAWATSTESGLIGTRELEAAKSAYIFALAHRDFKASNAQ